MADGGGRRNSGHDDKADGVMQSVSSRITHAWGEALLMPAFSASEEPEGRTSLARRSLASKSP